MTTPTTPPATTTPPPATGRLVVPAGIPLSAPAVGRATVRTGRVRALDALRGLAVVLMLVVNNPGDRDATPAVLRHAEWAGFTAADAVFPLFLFAVGAALPWSRRTGPREAVRRALLLLLLGAALSSVKRGELVLGAGVLQHVAGAYLVGWGLTRLPRHLWAPAAGLLLALGAAVYAFAGGPGVVPGSYAPGSTPAAALDRLVPGAPHSEGVLATLLSAASVVGGALIGAAARERPPAALRTLALRTGLLSVAAGLALAPVVPVVKALWTPSYALLGHGVACLVLAALLTPRLDRVRATALAVVVGANPLAVYVAVTLAALTVLRPVRALAVPALDLALPATVASVGWAALVAGLGVALAGLLHRRGITIRL